MVQRALPQAQTQRELQVLHPAHDGCRHAMRVSRTR
jgi:hypothetical protein